jgi:putative transcriptional regulator
MSEKMSRLTESFLEMAGDMRRIGILDKQTHDKITIRHLGSAALNTGDAITGAEIRALREDAKLSQAAFARYLNLTTGYVSQLERGVRHPKGPALTLFNLMRRKGVEAILTS